jgi:hypothetical protein
MCRSLSRLKYVGNALRYENNFRLELNIGGRPIAYKFREEKMQ